MEYEADGHLDFIYNGHYQKIMSKFMYLMMTMKQFEIFKLETPKKKLQRAKSIRNSNNRHRSNKRRKRSIIRLRNETIWLQWISSEDFAQKCEDSVLRKRFQQAQSNRNSKINIIELII